MKKESLILIVTKISTYWKQIQEQTERSIKSNWGFPFIAGFLALLFAAAVLLVVGLVQEAEVIATCAYFAIVVGVILQLVCFGKNRSKNGVMFDGSG